MSEYKLVQVSRPRAMEMSVSILKVPTEFYNMIIEKYEDFQEFYEAAHNYDDREANDLYYDNTDGKQALMGFDPITIDTEILEEG